MAVKPVPFYSRILFRLLLPILIIGIVCSTLLVAYMSSPMKDFLIRQFDANLRLASIMGLRICEERFNYLLDLRLEKNVEMNQVLESEAMEEIKAISTQFPDIHLMVVESDQRVKACSWNDAPKKWDGHSFGGQNDTAIAFKLGGKAVRAHVQFFPFWDWHIVSFVLEKDYNRPIRMAYTVTYLSSAGVFIAVVGTLLVVFHLFINKPLNRLVTATDGVANGKLSRIDRITENEFGRLMVSFNSMIDSLENEKAEIHNLIHQLKESEALFRSQFEFGNIGIAITSVEKGWVRANDRLCRMLGYSEEELLGTTWSELTHPEDLTADMDKFNRMLSGEIESYEMEKRYLHKNGDIVFTQLNVSCFRNTDRSIRFVIASLLDISDRKHAEKEKARLDAQLLQAQKMESVGHLAGGIAHDFNNMLSVVIGHTELGMSELDRDAPLHKRLKVIHDAARRSADLVRQLLAFARKQTISPKVLDINDTIAGMLKMLRQLIGEDINLAWMPGGHAMGKVRIDPSQVDQILANLMVNARDAIAGVGKVTIETGNIVLDETYCASHPGFLPGRFVTLAVSDSGSGMDEKTLAQIFDPFFSTKTVDKGTGLGLATVYGIVKQNDGFINVYSEPGQGTTFRIYLPVIESKEVEASRKATQEVMPKGTETVLIVEDDAAILDLGKSILEQLGYTVLTAGTPDAAIAVAQSHKGRIDLLLTDVVMPQMNGRQLAQRLGEAVPDLKCLFMSGYTANVIAHRGILDEGVNFLQKPFLMAALAAKVREVLDEEKKSPVKEG
jgi:PAS domain S-box-containing protein